MMNSLRTVQIMQKIPLFAGLQGDEYQQLLRICQIHRFEHGQALFAKGDSGHSMFVILSGEVRVVDEAGRELHRLLSGDVLGEVAVVGQRRRSAGAHVLEGTVLLELKDGGLELLLGHSPRVAYLVMRNIAEVLATRLVRANEALSRD